MASQDTYASSVLLSSEHWAELQALDIIQANLTTFMGKLSLDEQKEYLRHSKEHAERENTLRLALNRFYNELDQLLVDALEAALKLKVGKPVNARTTYLKTRIRQLPIPASELPDTGPNEPLGRQFGISKEDLSVREYERSMTLLEAAHHNFGFTAYFSTEEQNASYISDDALSVFDFVAVARQIDIGQKVQDYIEKNFASRVSIPLFSLHSTKLLLALYDAYRTEEPWSISAQEFNSLRLQLSDRSINWDAYQVDAGGEKIALPFYTRRFETPNGPRVYSYFPDRPSGAFRRHFSASEAVDELQQQLRNDVGLKQFNWFMKAISLNNQEKISTFIKPMTVNRDKLYWHARILYDLFASKTPNRQKLLIEKLVVDSRSLMHTLPITLSWPIQSDLTRLARNTRLADREAAVALLTYLVSETLSMLLIPVPGGVTGLSKVMLIATLGTLGYQTIEAVQALRQGRQAEMVQALSDIFDLVISARIQGVAGRLSSRRTRQLVRNLGYPKAHDRTGVWFMEAYTQIDPATLQGLTQNDQGLFEKDGQHYIRISVEGQNKVARVRLDATSGRYQLTHNAALYQPYVTYHPHHNRWTLDPIDTRPLSDSQLLQQMLAPTDQPLPQELCRRALKVAGVDRQQLLAIWSADTPAHWPLAQAVEDQHLREQLARLQTGLNQLNTPLPVIADQVLPALFADLSRCAISLYQQDGTTLLRRHEPVLAPHERALPSIELVQSGDGRYRTRARASTPDSWMRHALQEYERQNPNGTLGKTGHNAQDQHLDNRVHTLRKALGEHLGTHLEPMYLAMRAPSPRNQLSPEHATYRFAPSTLASETSVIATLRRRFPTLSTAAASELARLHPSLSTGDYSAIDAPARTAIDQHLANSTVIQALGALADPSGTALDANSQALFCRLLPLVPGWPENVAIQVYQATYDPAGRMIGRGTLLDTYGNPGADTTVMLVKDGNRYAGYLQHSGDLQVPPAGENSLVSATLRTLTDPQRNALERGIYDREGLVDDILKQSQVHRTHLPTFLPPSRELPLSSQTLQAFRAFDMRQVARQPDADGIYEITGRKYVNIDQVAYQVMLDRDASTPEGKVWRIVNIKDPVATDSDNIYHSSRSGETRAITRNARGLWMGVTVGALGGMRRTQIVHDNKAYLLQRFEPIKNAFTTLGASRIRYDELLSQSKGHAPASDLEAAALIALEVHTLKHTKLQESYVNALIENKEWLIHLKAGGLYKEELLVQLHNRVDFLNKLMVIMDLRIRPIIEKEITVDTCKKNLAHMSKKLKILEDRQRVVEQTQRLSRPDADEMDQANTMIPGESEVQVTRFNVFSRLLADDPQEPSHFGVNAAMSLHWVVNDLPNIPERSQPAALSLMLEQIAMDRAGYNALLETTAPEKKDYVKGVLEILDTHGLKLDEKLNELHRKLESNQDMSAYDQDIDVDFIPPQPAGSTEAVQPRKIFRTQRNGRYKVMVGVKETAPDGTVTVRVDNPFKADAPAQRYEKRQGEWKPTATTASSSTLPQLVSEANEQLSRIDQYVAEARAKESKKEYPTNIYEFLVTNADTLNETVANLEKTEKMPHSTETASLISRLKAGSETLMAEGKSILVRMYKNKAVLDIMRLDYLLDQSQLSVVMTVKSKQQGKGKNRSFLDVYSINDAVTNRPLWEAHFHYDKFEHLPLEYTVKGGHLKTLAQSRQGSEFQKREEMAGHEHKPIWREAIGLKVAKKLFDNVK